MRDCKRDAQTSGKKLIVSNTDELGGTTVRFGTSPFCLVLQTKPNMDVC